MSRNEKYSHCSERKKKNNPEQKQVNPLNSELDTGEENIIENIVK